MNGGLQKSNLKEKRPTTYSRIFEDAPFDVLIFPDSRASRNKGQCVLRSRDGLGLQPQKEGGLQQI
jgi:hypothetical protein